MIEDLITISQLSATDAGTYKLYCRLKQDNDRWFDNSKNSDGIKEFDWTINKHNGILEVDNSSSAVLHISNRSELSTKLVQILDASGNISVKSSSSSVARVTYSDVTNTVSIVASSVGSCVVSITSEETTNYKAKTISISIIVDSIIQENYAEIQQIVKDGQAQNYYNIGDLIPIPIKGTVGSLYINGTYYGCVVDFNHTDPQHPTLTKPTMSIKYPYTSNGKPLAFVDDKYNKYIDYNAASIPSNRMATSPSFCINPRRSNLNSSMQTDPSSPNWDLSQFWYRYNGYSVAFPNYNPIYYPDAFYLNPIVNVINSGFRSILGTQGFYTTYTYPNTTINGTAYYPDYSWQQSRVYMPCLNEYGFSTGLYWDFDYQYASKFAYYASGGGGYGVAHYHYKNQNSLVNVWARGVCGKPTAYGTASSTCLYFNPFVGYHSYSYDEGCMSLGLTVVFTIM